MIYLKHMKAHTSSAPEIIHASVFPTTIAGTLWDFIWGVNLFYCQMSEMADKRYAGKETEKEKLKGFRIWKVKMNKLKLTNAENRRQVIWIKREQQNTRMKVRKEMNKLIPWIKKVKEASEKKNAKVNHWSPEYADFVLGTVYAHMEDLVNHGEENSFQHSKNHCTLLSKCDPPLPPQMGLGFTTQKCASVHWRILIALTYCLTYHVAETILLKPQEKHYHQQWYDPQK